VVTARAAVHDSELGCGQCPLVLTTYVDSAGEVGALGTVRESQSVLDSLFLSPDFRWQIVLKMREQNERMIKSVPPGWRTAGVQYSDPFSFGVGDIHLRQKWLVRRYPNLVLLRYEVVLGTLNTVVQVAEVAYFVTQKEAVLIPVGSDVISRDVDSVSSSILSRAVSEGEVGGEDGVLCLAALLRVTAEGLNPFEVISSESDVAAGYRVYRASRRKGAGHALNPTVPLWLVVPSQDSCAKRLSGEIETLSPDSMEIERLAKQLQPYLQSTKSLEGTDQVHATAVILDLLWGTFQRISLSISKNAQTLHGVLIEPLKDPDGGLLRIEPW